MEHTKDGFNFYSFVQQGFPAFLDRGLGLMASGILRMRNVNVTVIGFGNQFAGWKAINAILAAFCLSSAKRNLAQPGRDEISAEELARQMKIFELLVLLDAGLDVDYIAAVAWLATQSPKQCDKLEERRVSFRNGVGLGIVTQGAFLLIWDIMLSLLAHKGRDA